MSTDIIRMAIHPLKGLVHFKMKITPSFTQPQAILGVYDFLLSDEHNRSYINKYPDASKSSEVKRCVCVRKISIFNKL